MVYYAARPRVRLMPLPLIVNGIDRSTSETDICRIVRQTFERATDGCSWLKRGDTVLLKVSLNSPDPYPATTSPLAVRAARLHGEDLTVVVAGRVGGRDGIHRFSGHIKGDRIEGEIVTGTRSPERTHWSAERK